MITIPQVFARLGEQPRGKIFLINLERTIAAGFIEQAHVHRLLREFSKHFADPSQLPESKDLADQLGGMFVGADSWLTSTPAVVQHYSEGGPVVLTRLLTYESFYRLLNSSSMPCDILPRWRSPATPHGGEIDDGDVEKVRRILETGEWRKEATQDRLTVTHMRCVWLTASSALTARQDSGPEKPPDRCRNLAGLSHVGAGRHLIRLDVAVPRSQLQLAEYRRPHGAGNGGSRFRFQFDDDNQSCGWGRTVDLLHVMRESESINGVPELLTARFEAEMEAITATYLGRVTCDAETKDDYFMGRLGMVPPSIPVVIERLCEGIR